MIVERATEDDLADVITIDAAHHVDAAMHYSTGRIQYLTEAVKKRECYIARESWNILGFVTLTQNFFGNYFIELLIVHPEKRHNGVATALMRHVEKIVPEDKLFTSTNESNAPMQALCEKLGYVKSGWIENLDEGDPEIIYFKQVKYS